MRFRADAVSSASRPTFAPPGAPRPKAPYWPPSEKPAPVFPPAKAALIEIKEMDSHSTHPASGDVGSKPRPETEEPSMRAKDVMTQNVVSVAEDAPVHEVVGLLLKYRISAVPVVDGAGKVVGIVSEGDLLRPEGASRATARRSWWLMALAAGQDYEKAHGRTSGAIMTRNVIAVNEETPLNEIAALLERHHIKRVPVLKGGRLTGIVSRANLLHGLASTIIDHHEPNAAKDRQMRDELVGAVLHKHGLDSVLVNVTVSDSNVRLWGAVENAEQAALAERAAKALPGVKSVENNLALAPVSAVPI